jgi:Zn-dependent M28 family amino/carboxypeptidase
MLFAPSGSVIGSLVPVSGSGCSAGDYPPETEGNIALVVRGGCNFAPKLSLAKLQGAAGVVFYNNVPGGLGGASLGSVGDYVPAVAVTVDDGQALLALAEAGNVVVELVVDATIEDRVTYNVIAETKAGNHDSVIALGAHHDSVTNGPGINDDGSGVVGLLVVAQALAMAGLELTNAVRFLFFSAEEFGLLGSNYYVRTINQTEGEIVKIRGYLNFDMIASPNYVIGVYDGDGSAFNMSGPPGSATIEAGFKSFFDAQGSPSVPTKFDGRSDYRAYLENGIACGGLSTGAEGIKTAEEASLFGGDAGVAYDPNYHIEGDTIQNINQDAFLLNMRAIADAVERYSASLDEIPAKTMLQRRAGMQRLEDTPHMLS